MWALSLKGLWLVESLGGDSSSKGGDFGSGGMAVVVHGVDVVVVEVKVGRWRLKDSCWVGCSGWRWGHALGRAVGWFVGALEEAEGPLNRRLLVALDIVEAPWYQR